MGIYKVIRLIFSVTLNEGVSTFRKRNSANVAILFPWFHEMFSFIVYIFPYIKNT
jgi:hypothetical protein